MPRPVYREKMVSLGNRTHVRRVAPDWDLSDALPTELQRRGMLQLLTCEKFFSLLVLSQQKGFVEAPLLLKTPRHRFGQNLGSDDLTETNEWASSEHGFGFFGKSSF